MARNGSLDIARLLAALGIVVFHGGPPARAAFDIGAVGYAGLPLFMLVLLLVGLPVAQRATEGGPNGGAGFIAGRARRLLGPWLVWSALYGGLKLAEVALTGKSLADEFAPWMLLTGPALHLWFLPFAFAVSALLPMVVAAKTRLPPAVQTLLALALVALMAVCLIAQPDRPLPIPLAQWVFVLPSVLLGLALGLGWSIHWGEDGGTRAQADPQTYPETGWAIALAAAATLGLCALIPHSPPPGLVQIALAFGLLVLCLLVPLKDSALSRFCARAALWVYLSHPMILSLLDRALPAPIWPGAPDLALRLGLTFALGLGLTLAAGRIGPRLRFAPSSRYDRS